jgi:Holliday junction resolvasome RuvABC endonuclease subunit
VLCRAVDRALRAACCYQPAAAAVEAQYVGPSRAGALALARLAACAECALVGVAPVIWRPLPAAWRAALGWPPLRSDAAKARAVELARLRGWETSDRDVADACAIAIACAVSHARGDL